MAEYMQGILSKAEPKLSSGKKSYCLIEIAGERATCWDKNVNALLPGLLGCKVSAEYTTSDDGEYRNITHVEAIGQTGASPRVPPPAAEAAPSTPQSPPNAQTPAAATAPHLTGTDVCIIRQTIVKGVGHIATDAGSAVAIATSLEAWVLDGFVIPATLDRSRVQPDDDVPF